MIGLFLFLLVNSALLTERGKSMVAIKTGEFNSVTGEYEVLCYSCEAVVSRETRSVLAEMTCGIEQVFCFDCDNVNTDVIPPLLAAFPGEKIIIYHPETNYYLVWQVANTLKGYSLFLSESSHLCLSSSPYLSLSEQKTGDRRDADG